MHKLLFVLLTAGLLFSCKKKASAIPRLTIADTVVVTPEATDSLFSKGADVGWLTEMEAAGKKFYNSKGEEQECMQLLKSTGINSIRLRVWVDPVDGYCNTKDVIVKALRAKALGMRIMIDFHYSDWWADPGKQNKPAAWSTYDFTALKAAVATHTTNVLNELKANGVTPTWVQIGNETNNGMLWPDGKASVNMNNFAQLVSAGYNAVKAVDHTIKVIVHVSNGYDNALFRWMFDGLKSNGVKWDIIGMSLYPTPLNWATLNNQCLANMKDMVTRYNSEVMVVEVGMSWDQPMESKAFISDLITKVKSVPSGKGTGVFYWEPQSYGGWKGYKLGAFDNSGKPSVAMDAFSK